MPPLMPHTPTALSRTDREPHAHQRPGMPPVADPGHDRESFAAFSEVLGHRLGNLLASIEGHTDLLIPVLEHPDDRENAFRILESVSRMNGILKDLRHYEETLDIRPHILEANRLTRSLMPLMADSESSRLKISSSLEDGIQVRADERLIRQALLSILRNAFEATRGDSLAISLMVDTIDDGNTIRYRIHSPIPIEDETVRRRLFDPFYTTKAANLGLGLTMARRIFRSHGGDVILSSTEFETGTEFSATLPRVLA